MTGDREKALTLKQLGFVEAYLGAARFNATEAARLAGYKGNDVTLAAVGAENLGKPPIRAIVQAWRDAVKTRGIANLEYRIARLDDLEQRFWEVIEARALEVGRDSKATGGKTGVIVKQHRIVGSGEDAKVLTEYVVDTALTKEIRAIYDDVAKELGQRVEKVEQTGGVTVHIVGVNVEAI